MSGLPPNKLLLKIGAPVVISILQKVFATEHVPYLILNAVSFPYNLLLPMTINKAQGQTLNYFT